MATPAETLAGLTFQWLEGSLGVTTTADPTYVVEGVIDAAADQSGGGYGCSATGSSRPEYTSLTWNGLPGWAFDGSNDYLNSAASSGLAAAVMAALNGGTPVSIWIAAQAIGSGDQTFLSFGNSADATNHYILIRQTASGLQVRKNAGSNVEALGGSPDALRHVYRLDFTTNDVRIWKDGVDVTAAGAPNLTTAAITLDRFSIGSLARTTNSNFGRVREAAIVVAVNPSAAQKTAVDSYFGKFTAVSTLPVAIIVGDSHAHQGPTENAWTELLETALGATCLFINRAIPGHTMAGSGGGLDREDLDVTSVLDTRRSLRVVVNAYFSNDVFGALLRTAAQMEADAIAWATAARTRDPGVVLVLQTPHKRGGGSTAAMETERAAFCTAADANYLSWGYRYIDRKHTKIPESGNNLAVFDVDETHLNDTGETRVYAGRNNADGSRFLFWRIGFSGLENMGTLSTYARTALVNHARNKGAYTAAANHYCAAFVAGVEVTGGAYARATLANNKTNWSVAASRAVTNSVAFVFPDATASWGTIDEIRIFDAASGGNELARHTLASTVPINGSTGPLTIPIGDIDITFPSGGFTNTVVHELADLMFGATANTPRVTVYGTYFAGDPQGAGVETSAVRTAITQATAWNAASSGLASTAVAIALADESDATYYAEFTAAAAGTLLFSAALPASFTPPVGGQIPAGGLRTGMS